jgi:peptide/nickel transport system ATP-binding protein
MNVGSQMAELDANSEPQARLSVRDLSIWLKGSNGADIVEEVSFDVDGGEVLGLVGESGSGKTTVALALLGKARRGLKIVSGSVLLDGVDIARLQPKQLRHLRGERVAYVPQDPSSALNPSLKIGTQLHEMLAAHQGAVNNIEQRTAEILDEVRLSPEHLARYPHQLSGGQQQRVGLAMAFACRPRLIVLDEPTTGLDVSTQRHILDTVRSLCADHDVAAVYISHDLTVVAGLATTVAVMYSGRIVEIGSTAKIYRRPVHPYTRGLLAAIPSADRLETLHGIDGQPPKPGYRPNGCAFAARCDLSIARCADVPPVIAIDDRRVRCWRASEIAAWVKGVADPPPAPDISNAKVLEVRNLSASYGRHMVLHDVTFSMPADCCVAVVGESGSGKTTLARAISGLHPKFRGNVIFDGKALDPAVRHRSQDTLRRIRYIFQNPYTSLNPRKTIGQILSQPLEHFFNLSAAEHSERVRRVLTSVSLPEDFLTKYPDQLSGGERQRVAIARALIVEPELLICDEVTSSLDVSVQAVIIELLRRLQAESHLTMLFITHNLALVRSIAQSVVVLSNGIVVEQGSIDDILKRPQHPYTKGLIDDVPKLPV